MIRPSRYGSSPFPNSNNWRRKSANELITVLSNNGGHLGPNLGVVELTIALHYVFNTPSDQFLFDVSHQAYVHKLLTGRQERFHTIRTPGGLNGFMLRTESPHDCYGAGHAGTALSAALGMAVARDKTGGKEHVVAVAGDAAFTSGITYEALNNIAHHTKRLIVILNDNEWSIDKNVGAIASYLNKIVTNPRYDHLHDRAGKLVEKVGGKTALRMARKAEEAAKGMLWPSVIFEELGLKYYGPIDGHDISTLIKTFEFLKKQDRPVLLHVLTQKGKGFEPAMQKQKKFHGLGPYDPETGETKPLSRRTYSEVFADTLVKLADYNPKVVAITAAMPNGTGLDRFQPHHPDKYFDVGIAEEHAVLFAAGLATKGFKPFCAIYSTFLQRAFDPIVHDVCLQNLPVVFCMDRGGLSADDGPTHHGLFDISYLRGIPEPGAHGSQGRRRAGRHAVHRHAVERPDRRALSARRRPRHSGEGRSPRDSDRQGRTAPARRQRPGRHLRAGRPGSHGRRDRAQTGGRRHLRGRHQCPLRQADRRRDAGILRAQRGGDPDPRRPRSCRGGFGSAVLEELSSLGLTTPVVRIGWPDQFIEHGKLDALRAKYGITPEAAIEKLRPYLQTRQLQPV